MDYRALVPQKPIELQRLYSVHYFEYSSSYSFAGEAHDFWELVYVDSGSITVGADGEELVLSRGQMIFHAPGEFHALAANGREAPSLVVIGFDCAGEKMDFFCRRVTFAGAAERSLLAKVVEESRLAFSSPLDDPRTTALERSASGPVGAEQLVAAALEELLIRLLRQGESLPELRMQPERSGESIRSIEAYLLARLDQPLTVEQICRDNMIGRSQLQKLFHDATGGGAMEYFGAMKIKAARRMIREGRLNMTQIAATLGFQSVHYFSRRFKQLTGMSPSEYAASVKMLAESKPRADDSANNL